MILEILNAISSNEGLIIGILVISIPIQILVIYGIHSFRTRTHNEEYHHSGTLPKGYSPSEDKVTNISMDNIKTKEEHPMGEKTHD